MNLNRNNHTLVKDLGFSLLAEGKILRIRANGYSMYPAIKPGSIIFIEPLADNADPVHGEIIAWKRETGFVVHRLIRTLRNGNEILYFTRGDSCPCEDNPVTRDQIAGKVIRVENKKGGIKKESQLMKNSCYFINRLIVRIILKLRRIYKLFK